METQAHTPKTFDLTAFGTRVALYLAALVCGALVAILVVNTARTALGIEPAQADGDFALSYSDETWAAQRNWELAKAATDKALQANMAAQRAAQETQGAADIAVQMECSANQMLAGNKHFDIVKAFPNDGTRPASVQQELYRLEEKIEQGCNYFQPNQ